MSKVKELTGQRFGLLTVVDRSDVQKNGKAYWKCLCECGNSTIVSGSNLRSGVVKSCGCLRHREKETHHLSATRLFRIWWAMHDRCKPNSTVSKYYNDKGITVCDEWQKDFVTFYNWAMNNGYNDELTIDRIDNNKSYCPENCRFVNRKVQANNRTMCKFILYNGKEQNLMQWCEELHLNYKLVYSRLYRCNWTFERAISEPVRHHKTRK